MAITIRNGDDTPVGTMSQLIVVLEKEPDSVLIVYQTTLEKGGKAYSIAEVPVPTSSTYVVSFQAAGGYWFQGTAALEDDKDYVLVRSVSGFDLKVDAADGATVGTLASEADGPDSSRFIRHVPVEIKPGSALEGQISLTFIPNVTKLEIDGDTREKTIWFIMGLAAPGWRVQLVKAVLSYESGGWDGAEQQVKAALQGPNNQARQPTYAFPYTIPPSILSRYEQPGQPSPPKLFLNYSLQVSIDPEVQMEGPN